MAEPTGSGKSLKFCNAPFVLDFYKHLHGEQDFVDTTCLVIFPLASLMKDQVSILCENEVKTVVLDPETPKTENREASEGKYQLKFTSPKDFQIHIKAICQSRNGQLIGFCHVLPQVGKRIMNRKICVFIMYFGLGRGRVWDYCPVWASKGTV